MRHIGTCLIVLIALAAFTTGCATKKWVREMVGQKEVAINEKFDRADADVRQQQARIIEHADRLSGLGTKVDGWSAPLATSATAPTPPSTRLTRLTSD